MVAIWYHFYNLKNVKSTHGGVTLLAKLKAATLLKVALLHECFSRFLSCKNATKSRKALHIVKAWMLCKPCIWREALSSNVSAYETDFEKSHQHCKCFDFFSQIDFFFFFRFRDSDQFNRFRLTGIIQWLCFILSIFIVSPVNYYW